MGEVLTLVVREIIEHKIVYIGYDFNFIGKKTKENIFCHVIIL